MFKGNFLFYYQKEKDKKDSKNITWLSDKLPNSSAIEIDAADCKTFRPAMTPPLIVENSTYRKKNHFKTGRPD